MSRTWKDNDGYKSRRRPFNTNRLRGLQLADVSALVELDLLPGADEDNLNRRPRKKSDLRELVEEQD